MEFSEISFFFCVKKLELDFPKFGPDRGKLLLKLVVLLSELVIITLKDLERRLRLLRLSTTRSSRHR